MTTPTETLGERLKAERVRREMTQQELAAHLGTTRWRVIAWEGDNSFPRQYAAKIARFLKVSADEIKQEALTSPLRQELRKLTSRLQLLEARLDLVVDASARGFEALGLQQHGLGGLGEDRKTR